MRDFDVGFIAERIHGFTQYREEKEQAHDESRPLEDALSTTRTADLAHVRIRRAPLTCMVDRTFRNVDLILGRRKTSLAGSMNSFRFAVFSFGHLPLYPFLSRPISVVILLLSNIPSIMQIRRTYLALATFVLLAASPVHSKPLDLILPTSNDALMRGDGPSFYQYTDRYFDGVRSRPWQGGQYGFVRNPKYTSNGIIYTRFHEGLDIKPLYRDHRGEPLDTVRAIDDGYVVYVNEVEHSSSYGKYIVVEHWWSGSPFYSLYAHLADVHVRNGQRVFQAERLGRIGYTGRGLDRRRAHLHFEINMMLNESFHEWHGENYRSTNRHGLHNGINLAGLNVGELYERLRREPDLTIDRFILSQEVAYKVAVPNQGVIDLTYRYDWLESSPYAFNEDAESWEISFTASGLPVHVEASSRKISSPTVIDISQDRLPYGDLTKGIVAGSHDKYHLSKAGQRYASLIMHVGRERTVVKTNAPTFREVSDTESERLRSW